MDLGNVEDEIAVQGKVMSICLDAIDDRDGYMSRGTTTNILDADPIPRGARPTHWPKSSMTASAVGHRRQEIWSDWLREGVAQYACMVVRALARAPFSHTGVTLEDSLIAMTAGTCSVAREAEAGRCWTSLFGSYTF